MTSQPCEGNLSTPSVSLPACALSLFFFPCKPPPHVPLGRQLSHFRRKHTDTHTFTCTNTAPVDLLRPVASNQAECRNDQLFHLDQFEVSCSHDLKERFPIIKCYSNISHTGLSVNPETLPKPFLDYANL